MQGINANLAISLVDQPGGNGLPALQVTNYKPRTLNEVIQFCVSADSVELLPDQTFEALQLTKDFVNYGQDDVKIGIINAPVRWICLGQPRLFLLNKAEKTYAPLTRGSIPAGFVTATRLALVPYAGGNILLNNEGDPQIFTLKLTSNKTRIVAGSKGDRSGSIAGLNDALLKHYSQPRGLSLVHLCSIEVTVKPERFTSSRTGESSTGVMYALGGAKPLPPSLQTVITDYVRTEFVQGLLRDPFGLEQPPEPPAPVYAVADTDLDEIPY